MKKYRGANVRPAPAYMTAALVKRVLDQIGAANIVTPCPVVPVPVAGVKPTLRVVEPAKRVIAEKPEPSPQNHTADNQTRADREAGAAEIAAPAVSAELVIRQWSRHEAKALKIGFDRGLAVHDIGKALGRTIFAVSRVALRHDMAFGRRPLLAEPIDLAGILALEDPEVPLPPFGKRPHCCKPQSTAKAKAPPKPRADPPELTLLRIAHKRGLAIFEVIRAAPRSVRTIKRLAANHGFQFGNRPLLAEPLTVEQLLALADEAIPLPAFKPIVAPRPKRATADKAKAKPTAEPRLKAVPASVQRIQSASPSRMAAEPRPALSVRTQARAAPSSTPHFLAYAERVNRAREYLQSRHCCVRRHCVQEIIPRWSVLGYNGLFSNEELVELAVHLGMQVAA